MGESHAKWRGTILPSKDLAERRSLWKPRSGLLARPELDPVAVLDELPDEWQQIAHVAHVGHHCKQHSHGCNESEKRVSCLLARRLLEN
jgi:hypothetical protein